MRSNDIIPETLEGLKSGGGHLRKQDLLLNTYTYLVPKSRGKRAIAPLLPQIPPALYSDFGCLLKQTTLSMLWILGTLLLSLNFLVNKNFGV